MIALHAFDVGSIPSGSNGGYSLMVKCVTVTRVFWVRSPVAALRGDRPAAEGIRL